MPRTLPVLPPVVAVSLLDVLFWLALQYAGAAGQLAK
jgi:hypothetical protein